MPIASAETLGGAASPDMADAPEVLDAWEGEGMRLLDDRRRHRATIRPDGEIIDSKGNVMGFAEPNGDVGSHEMDFLGHADLHTGQVTDRDDKCIGEFDQGRGYVKDKQGSVVAEISKEGQVIGNGSQTAGVVQGFTFDQMHTIAAYVLLVDPRFVAGF